MFVVCFGLVFGSKKREFHSGVARVMKLEGGGGGGRTSAEGARFLGGPRNLEIFISGVSKTLFLTFSGRFNDNLKSTHR